MLPVHCHVYSRCMSVSQIVRTYITQVPGTAALARSQTTWCLAMAYLAK